MYVCYVEYQNGLIQNRSGGGADSKAAADELNDERKRILEEREKWEQEKTQVLHSICMYVCMYVWRDTIKKFNYCSDANSAQRSGVSAIYGCGGQLYLGPTS
jgi:hypothetical protein